MGRTTKTLVLVLMAAMGCSAGISGSAPAANVTEIAEKSDTPSAPVAHLILASSETMDADKRTKAEKTFLPAPATIEDDEPFVPVCRRVGKEVLCAAAIRGQIF